jgi:hypothetical protein
MRIFPSFVWRGAHETNPAQFAKPPVLRRFLPNYVRMDFRPFEDLEAQCEYWVPDSHSVAGRIVLRNLSMEIEQVRLRIHSLMRPGENGQAMSGTVIEGVTVLAGRSGSLTPVIFVGGGATAEPAAYPALTVSFDLSPGEARAVPWAHAGLRAQQASFASARSQAAQSWDAEIARIEHANASLVDIQTGDQDWDAALAMAQKVALGSFLGPTRHMTHASFVLSRRTDHGYSEGGRGEEYGDQWNGQTAADAFACLPLVWLPAPELAKGVIRNFLAIQKRDGSIDWKPGMGGQRNGALCIPLLSTLTWMIYQHTEDRLFLEETLDGLLAFLDSWFAEDHDRDQDGYPEWDNILQAGFDDWPTFVRWKKLGQGLDITKAETPDLACYLLRECRSLIRIAEELGRDGSIPALEARAAALKEAIESAWSESSASYHHRDRDQHGSPAGELLGKGQGGQKIQVDKQFDPPVRVLIRVSGPEDKSQKAKVSIRGRGKRGRGRVERLDSGNFQWFWEFGTATSEKTYAEIKGVELRGFSKHFKSEVWAADFLRQDQTLLLPLWAGVPDSERAGKLVHQTLLDRKRYWRRFGIPACSARDPAYAPGQEGAGALSMLWNTMIGEGLVDHGYQDEAAVLVGRLMEAVLGALRRDKAFREAYHPDEEEGFGERDHILGLAPLHLFLYALGVRLISPTRLWLRGHNPYPWPVVVRWRGLSIRREGDHTEVTFPDGQQAEVTGEEPRFVEQLETRLQEGE